MEFKLPTGILLQGPGSGAREPRRHDQATSPERRVEPVDQSAMVDGMKQETPPFRAE